MYKSDILPFGKEVSDPLYEECLERLKKEGNPLNEADFFQIYLEAHGHIVHAVQEYGRFWKNFQDTEIIDAPHPLKTLFIRIHLHNGPDMKDMSLETKNRSFLLLATRNNRFIARATSVFLTEMVRELKRQERELQYAAI